jgi:predicted Zn-dependent peptidase
MKLIILILTIQGVILSATLNEIEVNGVKVPIVYEQSDYLPTVDLKLVFRNSGSSSNKTAGLANMVAAILNEGTLKLGNSKFADKLDSRAISLSSAIGSETFVIELSSLKENFSFGYKLLLQLLSDPNFSDEAFGKIKSSIIGKLLTKESDFDFQASLNLKKIIFKNTPLEHSSIGNQHSIEKISIDSLKEFYNSHITIDNLLIVAGGDIELSEIKKMLPSLLSPLAKGKSQKIEFIELKKRGSTKEFKSTEQAYIYFASPFNMRVDDKDVYVSKVASYILGSSGFGSRLMEEIRVKRGLAYSAYSRFAISKSKSYFSGYLQTKIENEKEAIDVVKKVISDFIKNGVTKKELESAKKFILGSEPLRNETLSSRISRSYLNYYNELDLNNHIVELQNIENLSLEELNKFIKKHTEILDMSWSIITKDTSK